MVTLGTPGSLGIKKRQEVLRLKTNIQILPAAVLLTAALLCGCSASAQNTDTKPKTAAAAVETVIPEPVAESAPEAAPEPTPTPTPTVTPEPVPDNTGPPKPPEETPGPGEISE